MYRTYCEETNEDTQQEELEKEKQILLDFTPRNPFQHHAKEFMLQSFTNSKDDFYDESSNPVVKDRMYAEALTESTKIASRLLRELVVHKKFIIIGRWHQKSNGKLSLTIERFPYRTTDEKPTAIFAFSDEQSFDNFQRLTQGRVMEYFDASGYKLSSMLHTIYSKHDPTSFLDGSSEVTSSIVIDPNLPSYCVIHHSQFEELPRIYAQVTLEGFFRRLQWDLHRKRISSYSQLFLDAALVEYKNYFGIVINSSGDEGLFTIHKEDGEIFTPIFTDGDLATEFFDVVQKQREYSYLMKEGGSCDIFEIDGQGIIDWLCDNEEIKGLLINPKSDIFDKFVIPQVTNTCEFIMDVTTPGYDLPDAPGLPYLCLINRDLLVEEVDEE